MAAPTISNITPAEFTQVASTDFLQFDVTCPTTIAQVILSVEYPGIPTEELVLSGSTYTSNFQLHSAVSTITNGYRYRFRRAPCWPDALVVRVFAVNTSAEILNDTISFGFQATNVS